jgi:methyl-accepting chemotaxis protein
MLKNATIARKLQLVFVAIGGLLLVLLAVGLFLSRQAAGVTTTLVEVRLPNAESLGEMEQLVGGVGRAVYAIGDAQLPADVRESNFKEIGERLAALEKEGAAFDARPKSAAVAAAWKTAKPSFDSWREASLALIPVVRHRDAVTGEARVAAQAAYIKALGESRRVRKELDPRLHELQQLSAERSHLDAVEAATALRTLEWSLGLVTLAIVAIAIFAFFFLRKEIASFIGLVGEKMRDIASGELPETITETRGPDFNELRDAVNQVSDTLRELIAEMNRMSAAHERGDIDVETDVVKFEGAYAQMAKGINQMVGAHITVKKQAMGVFGEFGQGNFEAPMPELPGKKRFINDTIEKVRANLKSLVADTGMLSKAAVEGRLEVRADVSKQPGDFRKIVQGVNDTLDAVNAPTRELAGALERLAQGDLSARTDPARFQNEARALLEGINKTLGTLLAPSEEATRILGQLSERDLRARMSGNYAGEHAKLKDAVNATADALEESLSQVASAVEQVASASQQIAASSQAVASGASEQASSLQETGSSIESVASITKQAADNAQQANTLSQTAREAATQGASAVEQMQGAMGKIKASAEGTSQIIKDINDIAFQTNLLALNAAVEAARAGEAGRGFAVVAEEVRSLALRAKEAATKTEELIRQSVKEAGEGEVTSKQVAGKLAEIVSGISKVSDIVSEIAAAAKEQSAGIDQVNQAISEMDKVTQQNAASAEQSSSAASELNGQSEELAAMVASFKLTRGGPASKTVKPNLRPGGASMVAPRKAAPPAKLNGKSNKAQLAEAFPMDDLVDLREF